MSDKPKGLAKVTWTDPETGEPRHYVLMEGATVTIGRSRDNEICIPEQHVSRKHSVISHQYGIFMISDLGSANKTFVNDQELEDAFPLAHGDVIRLFVPEIHFSAVVTEEDHQEAIRSGSVAQAVDKDSRPRLMITAGQQEGAEIPIMTDSVSIGRAVQQATWEIRLEDRAVSRPHARIEKRGSEWFVVDLDSANGTVVANKLISEPTMLQDGSVIAIGQTTILFRLGGSEADSA